jgi:hypothetical protein
MKLEIKAIHAAGDLSMERLVLEAVEDVDVGNHLVFAARRSEKTLQAGRVPFCYWMPDKKVAKGDLVVLYTKAGDISTKQNQTNNSFFFYWNLAAPVWVGDQHPVLVEITTWKGWKVEDVRDVTEV